MKVKRGFHNLKSIFISIRAGATYLLFFKYLTNCSTEPLNNVFSVFDLISFLCSIIEKIYISIIFAPVTTLTFVYFS